MGKLVHGSLLSGFGFLLTPLSSLEGFFCPNSCPKVSIPKRFPWLSQSPGVFNHHREAREDRKDFLVFIAGFAV
jgi:hypothetical protein